MPKGTRRKPAGTYVRPTPDWFVNSLGSTGQQILADPANVSYIGLFNDGAPSRYLHIYSLVISAETDCRIQLTPWLFLVGTQGNELKTILSPRASLNGHLYAGHTGVGVADNVPTILLKASEPLTLDFGYPLAILPSGHGHLVRTIAVNVTLYYSVWALDLADPG